jgi:hypothetical protein
VIIDVDMQLHEDGVFINRVDMHIFELFMCFSALSVFMYVVRISRFKSEEATRGGETA